MDAQKRTDLIGLAALLLACIPLGWREMEPGIELGFRLAAGVCGLLFVVLLLRGVSWRWKMIWPQILMVVCFAGLMVGLTAFLQKNVHPSQIPRPAAGPPASHPPTLLEAFNSDFPVGSLNEDTVLHTQDGHSYSLKTRLFGDFRQGSKFMSFYVTDGPEAYRTIELLADAYADIMRRQEAQVDRRGRFAGENRTIDASELRFTGMIFIYSRSDFSVQQQAALATLYQQRNLTLRLRGPDYETANLLRWQADQAKSQK